MPLEVTDVTESATTLGIGDPAPSLSIDRWVTGEPIDKLDPGQVYVIEFWVMWCRPCRTSMPHLSQLQQHYGDKARFVGVTRETEDTGRSFLLKAESAGKTWSEVIKYRLAIDSHDATDAAYMRAAGQTGIPTAFILGWHGGLDRASHVADRDAASHALSQPKHKRQRPLSRGHKIVPLLAPCMSRHYLSQGVM